MLENSTTMNKEFYYLGDNEELDLAFKILDWYQAVAVLYDIHGLINTDQAQFYFERHLAENEIVNSPLYKLMREEEE